MKELALCIEHLLMSNDRLTLPGVGLLSARWQSAVYDEDEDTMLPPRRMVDFAADAQCDGDQLTSGVQQLYAVSLGEAERKVAQWTMELQHALEDYGVADLGSIGTFAMDNGNVTFTSSPSGIVSPAHYALDAYYLKPLVSRRVDEWTSRREGGWMGYVAAACAAVLLFFCLGQDSPSEQTTRRAEVQTCLLGLTSPCEQVAVEVDEVVEVEMEEIEEIEETAEATIEEVEEIEPTHCIVVASAISMSNAQRYAAELQSRGYTEAKVVTGNVTRVIISEHSCQEDAEAAAASLRQSSPEFRQAWVRHI